MTPGQLFKNMDKPVVPGSSLGISTVLALAGVGSFADADTKGDSPV